MIKVKILNVSNFDVVVDLKGNNDVRDKVIIPPKVTIETKIEKKVRQSLNSDKRLRVTQVKE